MQKAPFKIPALILCGLLIYNSLGYFIVLSVMRVAVRHQKLVQLSTVPDQHLIAFAFGKNKTTPHLKILNSHEIEVDGRLYDIARKTITRETVIYYCSYDPKEEKLIAKTRQFNSMNQPIPAKNTTRLILEKIIKTAIQDQKTADFDIKHSFSYSHCLPQVYSGPVLLTLVPPPQPCS